MVVRQARSPAMTAPSLKHSDKRYTSCAESIDILAPPPTSLLSPVSAWSSFAQYFLDEHGRLDEGLLQSQEAQQLRSFVPSFKAPAASSSVQDARRRIIGSLSVRPSSRCSSPEIDSSSEGWPFPGQDESEVNPFTQYALLERNERKRAHSTAHPRAVAHQNKTSISAPSSPAATRKSLPAANSGNAPLHQSNRKRAKSVEEALTRLGWFWNSESEAMWSPSSSPQSAAFGPKADSASHKTSGDDTAATFLGQYAAGELDLNDIEPGCPCPSLIMPAPLPPYEEARKRMICRSGVFSLPPEILQRLHAISAHIRDSLNMAIFMLDVLFGEEGWEVTADGVQHHNNFRRETICAHTILNAHRGLTIPNLKADWRFMGNPILTPVSFYSGYPIKSSSGLPLGALCVMDVDAHASFSDEQKGLVKLAAEQVSFIIESHFADNFLLKMTRLASTYESIKTHLRNMSRRALPRLDPSTFSLRKPLNVNDGYLSLGGNNRDLFTLNRCCQRIAAAMDLDAAYIVAIRPGSEPAGADGQGQTRTHTLARSSNICPPYHPDGAGDCYMAAFDSVNDEGCAVFQNALDGFRSAPLPLPGGSAVGKSFTCAMVLPLVVRTRFNREEASPSSPPKVHFALVAASLQPRHVLGIEDLRFLQSLQPHLVGVLQRCVAVGATSAAHGSINVFSSLRNANVHAEADAEDDVDQLLDSMREWYQRRGASDGEQLGYDMARSASRSPKAAARPLPVPLPTSSRGVQSHNGSSSTPSVHQLSSHVAAHFQDHYRQRLEKLSPRTKSNVDLPAVTQSPRRATAINREAHVETLSPVASVPSSPASAIPFPAGPSGYNPGRRGSGSNPLTRFGSPLKILQAADSIRNTLNFQNRRGSNGNPSYPAGRTARGSADSSVGNSVASDAGHTTSSSLSTSLSSDTPLSKASLDHSAKMGARLLPPYATPSLTLSGPQGLPEGQQNLLHNSTTNSSSSSITLTPSQAGRPAKNSNISAPVLSQPHTSLLSVRRKLRRPMSAKSHKDDDEQGTERQTTLGVRFNEAFAFNRPGGSAYKAFVRSHDERYQQREVPPPRRSEEINLRGEAPLSPAAFVDSAPATKRRLCKRCLHMIPHPSEVKPLPTIPATPTSTLPTKTSMPRLRVSPRRPRTGGEHPREPFDFHALSKSRDNSGPTFCTCIVPTPQVEHSEQAMSYFGNGNVAGPPTRTHTSQEFTSDLELRDVDDEMQELMLVDSAGHRHGNDVHGSSSGGEASAHRDPLRRLSQGSFNRSGVDLSIGAPRNVPMTVPLKTSSAFATHQPGLDEGRAAMFSPSQSCLALHSELGSDVDLSSSGVFLDVGSLPLSSSCASMGSGLAPRPRAPRARQH